MCDCWDLRGLFCYIYCDKETPRFCVALILQESFIPSVFTVTAKIMTTDPLLIVLACWLLHWQFTPVLRCHLACMSRVAVIPSVEVLGTGLQEWGARCWLSLWLYGGSAPAGQVSCWFVVQSADPALVAASRLVMLLVTFCFMVAVTWVVWNLFSVCHELLLFWGESYFEWKMGFLSVKLHDFS